MGVMEAAMEVAMVVMEEGVMMVEEVVTSKRTEQERQSVKWQKWGEMAWGDDRLEPSDGCCTRRKMLSSKETSLR